MQSQIKHTSPLREFRDAVLNGEERSPEVIARLEALGVDVGALEQRLLQQIEWRH